MEYLERMSYQAINRKLNKSLTISLEHLKRKHHGAFNCLWNSTISVKHECLYLYSERFIFPFGIKYYHLLQISAYICICRSLWWHFLVIIVQGIRRYLQLNYGLNPKVFLVGKFKYCINVVVLISVQLWQSFWLFWKRFKNWIEHIPISSSC